MSRSIWSPRYTDSKLGFTGDDYLDFFRRLPEAVAEHATQPATFYGRGEAVWSLFDGSFKNYFGVNYSNQWTWIFDPNADFFFTSPLVAPPTTNVGERTKIDWRGEAQSGARANLVLGLEHERQTLRTDSTGMVDAFFNYTQMTTTAETGNPAGYIELQSEFAKRFFLVANIRYDDNDSFGPHVTWRVAPAVHRSGHRNQAQGELRHRLQGADADAALRQQPVLHGRRQSRICCRKPARATISASSSRYGTIGCNLAPPISTMRSPISSPDTSIRSTFTFTYVNVGEAKMRAWNRLPPSPSAIN